MTRMPWELTPEQQRAALLTRVPMLASAGAGSGKTAVMAVRYCACLLDRDDDGKLLKPERVLALSFTREAAANLRARIDRTLRAVARAGRFSVWTDGEGIAPGDLDEERRAHLRECLAELPGAPITTLDAFCLELVREHAAELGRDPELAPPEEVAWRACRDAAWARLERAALDGDAALPRLVEAYGADAVRGAVQALADQASTAARPALRASGGDPLAELLAARAPQLDALAAAVRAARGAVKPGGKAHEVLSALEAAPPRDPLALCGWLRALDELENRERGADAKDAIRRMHLALEWPNRRADEDKRPGKPQRRRRGSLASLGLYDPELEAALAARAADFAALATAYGTALDDVAERAGVGGFARVQAEALALLEDAATRRRLGARWRHVLLDEAQDLNRLQGRLVELLRDGGRPHGSARVFIVGDHRQSIYGFRHAAPEVFVSWEAAIVADGGAIAGLEHNFRSHPELVEAVKRVVGQRALREAFRPDAIRAGRDDASDGVAPMSCWRVEALVPGATAPPRAGALVSTRAQAAHVARLIVDSLAGGHRPEDHAILLRTRSRMRAYALALERAGVPYDTDFPGGLIDSQECHDVEAMLRLALDPHDRQALAVALGGPWGVADAQDRTALWEALSLSPELGWAYACQRTALGEVAGGLAPILAREGFACALRRLIADPRLAQRYARLPLARRRFANLLALADEERSAGRALDGHAFVARLAERRRLGVDVGEATGEAVGGRGVRLMTVHGSKGLEWPVVLVPDLDREFALRDLRGPALAIAGDDGLALACLPGAVDAEEAIGLRAGLAQERLRARLQDEEARLFYVACTRARERLHCLVGADCDAPDDDGRVGRCGDWLVGADAPWRAVQVDPDAPIASVVGGVAVALGEPLPALRVDADEALPVVSVTSLVGLVHDEEPSIGDAGSADRGAARDLGTQVHKLLAIHGAAGMTIEQAQAGLAPFRGRIDADRLARIQARLVQGLMRTSEYWDHERLVEHPVVRRIGDRLVIGIVDLLLKSGDGWRLYDWKTGDAADHAAARAQVLAYARLVRPLLDAPLVEAALIDVERGRVLPVALDPREEEAAWRLVATARDV